MKHVVLTNASLTGFQYGMLRDFEDEIVRITGASRIDAPTRRLPKFVQARIQHGTRLERLRPLILKEDHDLRADVLWVVMMGAESFTMDLFKGWDRHVGTKVLYLFDTMESQLVPTRRVSTCTDWDVLITSFSGARGFLEEQTQRRWHAVAQGVKLDRFQPAAPERKVIDYVAYGRRLQGTHQALRKHCKATGRHYDYTVAATLQPQIDPRESYSLYAWHLNHAIFNVSWPVELTNPDRVATFSPITCRWFEAAASGNVVLGGAPKDPTFGDFFDDGFVIPLDPGLDEEALGALWQSLWAQRSRLLAQASERRARLSARWTWEARVREILDLIEGRPRLASCAGAEGPEASAAG